jgi:endonuclease/exonuclease/phosphatase family metal-dependent hydrolase
MALVATLVAICALVPASAQAQNAEPTVMTRNLYLGASLTPIVVAANTGGDVVGAAQVALGKALGPNNFAARAPLIAAEINATKPDLVGLQEVSTFTSGLIPGGVFDYEPILLSLLPDYEKVREDTESTFGVPGVGSLELSNVILKRKRPDLVVSNPRGAPFATQAVLIPGQPITRNWQAVDASLGKANKDFVFLNTHLEAGNDAISAAQASELIAGPLRSTKPVVAVGDFNSGPGGPPTAYARLTARNNGKMRDAAASSGNTCCFPEILTFTGSLSERIDLILTNPASVKTLAVTRTGAAQVGGIYPSDHAGVVAKLRVP